MSDLGGCELWSIPTRSCHPGDTIVLNMLCPTQEFIENQWKCYFYGRKSLIKALKDRESAITPSLKRRM